MGEFLALANAVIDMMRLPVTVYGFTFTFLDLFVFMLLAGYVISFLSGLFSS